jgi:ABC-type multidrug transport system fused ATPase/permease subunit
MHAAGHAFLAAAAGVLARALAGASPVVAGSTSVLRWSSGGTEHDGAAVLLAICGVFAALAKLVGGAVASWGEAQVAGDVGASVRLAVLDGVLAVESSRGSGHHDHGSADDVANGTRGDRLAALTTHVSDVERGVAHGVLSELRAILQLVPLGVLLIVLAPRLAGSAVVALGGFGAVAFALRRGFKRAHVRASASAGALASAADDAVRHAELWATYGAERRIRAHVTRIGHAIAREAARIRVRASLLSSTSEVLGAIALVLVLLLAARGALGIDHGTVVPFAIAFFMAYQPLRALVDARIARARGEEALRSALVAVSPPERGEAASERPSTTRARLPRRWTLETLVLDRVRALHGAHAPISITVPPGAIAAVVGPTGVGKTSLLRALLGLESLRAGEVRYGGGALGGAGVGPSERPFAWVPQDAPIVSDTLEVNVALGHADDAANVEPSAVLAELGADGLAAALGGEVLATARPLSGGERQWIAVARALVTGLPVLLLDEPTSALDGVSQERLLGAIARLRGKRTVILVTHRPEPLAIADVVVQLRSEDVEDRAGRHLDRVGAEEIAVEDVRALAIGEAKRELVREGVDAWPEERASGEDERHLGAERARAERRRDDMKAVGLLGGAIEEAHSEAQIADDARAEQAHAIERRGYTVDLELAARRIEDATREA